MFHGSASIVIIAVVVAARFALASASPPRRSRASS